MGFSYHSPVQPGKSESGRGNPRLGVFVAVIGVMAGLAIAGIEPQAFHALSGWLSGLIHSAVPLV